MKFGWIDDVMAATEESESPRSYYFWAALSAISAVMKKQTYLERHYYQLFPNIFVILVGKSGLRKGVPVHLAKQLVEKVDNTRVISGRISVPALITELGTQYTRPGGIVVKDSAGFLVTSEFASFIVADPSALTILTDLYDAHYNPNWKNRLKGTGTDTLKDVCLTMLGASNQIHLKESIPDDAIGGGFVARTFFIVEERRHRINSLTSPPKFKPNVDKLANWLFQIASLRGQFTYSMAGQSLYDEWYQQFCEKLDQKNDDKTGLAERIGDHVLKVAMLLSLSKRIDLVLDEEDISQAIEACMGFAVDVEKSMIAQPAKQQLANQTKIVMQELLAAEDNTILRSILLRNNWGNINAMELDVVIETLVQAEAITVGKTTGGDTSYKLTPEMLQRYRRIKQGS